MRNLYRRGMSSRPLRVDRSDLLVVTAVTCRSIGSPHRHDRLALVVAAWRVLVAEWLRSAKWRSGYGRRSGYRLALVLSIGFSFSFSSSPCGVWVCVSMIGNEISLRVRGGEKNKEVGSIRVWERDRGLCCDVSEVGWG
ncbi:unnamed protein product [Linum trigynum]